MAGFQTLAMPRPQISNGRPPTPIVNIDLVRPVAKPCGKHTDRVNLNTGLSLVTKSLTDRARVMRAEGTSLHVIAAALKTSPSTVRKLCKDVPPPEGGWQTGARPSIIKIDKAQRMKRAGFTYKEIGEEFGLSARSAWRALHEPVRRCAGGGKRRPIGHVLTKAWLITRLRAKEMRRNPTAIDGKSSAQISKARHLLFWVLHRRYGFSLLDVGNSLGGFDHSSVWYGIKRVDQVASDLAVKLDTYPMRIFRKLWDAEWPARKTP